MWEYRAVGTLGCGNIGLWEHRHAPAVTRSLELLVSEQLVSVLLNLGEQKSKEIHTINSLNIELVKLVVYFPIWKFDLYKASVHLTVPS